MLNTDNLVIAEEILFIATVITYLVSSVLYIWHLVTRNRRAVVMGFVLLALGLVAQTASLLLRWYTSGHAPMSDTYESLSLFAWGVVLAFIITERFYPVKSAGAIVVPSAFLISLVALIFYEDPADLVPALQSYWLWIHVSIAMIAYGLFALAFGAGFFYIVQEYLLKKQYENVKTAFVLLLAGLGAVLGLWFGSWWSEPEMVIDAAGNPDKIYAGIDIIKIIGSLAVGLLLGLILGSLAGRGAARPAFSTRLPSLDVLDEVSYRAIAIGFPMLTIGIATGAIWADIAWGRWWGWDPKETWSAITWFYYGAYLHTRLTLGWRGRHSALIAVTGMAVVLFTYFGVNFLLSGLHAYA
ncbi:MAG: c-type cytochrome biogenesis protein CcsB [Gaiellales bacterium]|nr:MAG: c-type cytochrome biogenesis protein CcsB [Gaiellales bacterium]